MSKIVDFLFVGAFLLFAVSCTEEIIIDVEEGDRMIGVAATFTDELKNHEAILSYTDDFYNNNEDIRMVTGATVYVTDGIDTIFTHVIVVPACGTLPLLSQEKRRLCIVCGFSLLMQTVRW